MTTPNPAPTKGQEQPLKPTNQPPADDVPNYSLLAADAFGDEFVGEVEQPKAPKRAQADNGDDTVDEPELASGEAAEGEQDGERQDGDDAGGEQDDADGDGPADGEPSDDEVIQSLNDWNNKLLEDPAKAGQLKIQIKVDGAVSEVTLADLRDNFQINKATTDRLEEAKQINATAKQVATQRLQSLSESLAAVAVVLEDAEAALNAEESGLAKLRQDDPAEFAARKEEIRARRQALDAKKQGAVTAYQRAVKQEEERLATELRETTRTERLKLIEALPEWRDPKKREAGQAQLTTYLVGAGFDKKDIANAIDHRLILMARKAMLFDQQQAKTNKNLNRLRQVPKVLNPGAPKPSQQRSQQKVQAARTKLQNSGSLEDAHALLMAEQGSTK